MNAIARWNTRSSRVAVLFCGRPIPVREIGHRFRAPTQVLHLLPYVVPMNNTNEVALEGPFAAQFQEGFVNERRGVERVFRCLGRHLRGRKATQLVVHKR